jgi:glycosyltransferase involved in cell wall biosynthesis
METPDMPDVPCVDLFYLACNRLEFTRETFETLLANTDWKFVNELFVYDDGSIDGTREWLEENVSRAPVKVSFRKTAFGSPVTAMVDFIRSSTMPVLAKTDNDAMLPPGWLAASLKVLDAHPELSLLGIEAMYPHSEDMEIPRSYTPAQFISGLGLYRREAFARSLPEAYDKWFGLEEWQMFKEPQLVRGWITPALPVFLLDRYPFEPWIAYSCSYTQRGLQRNWPKYDKHCTLWKWRWPEWIEKPLEPDSRFLCVMRIKNEAAYIHEVLARALRLCARAIVFDDHSTDATPEICRSFAPRLSLIPSPFQGLDETRDKNFLLEQAIRANPDWVLWIDGDEVLERTGPEQIRTAVAQSPWCAAWYLRIAYLWNDSHKVRTDGLFGNFRRLSLFRLRDQDPGSLKFRNTGYGGNFHCGNVPEGLKGEFRDLPIRLKHYGYMDKKQRLAKYAFYTKADPNNELEDNYRHLAEIPGARHAPGPARLVPWEE